MKIIRKQYKRDIQIHGKQRNKKKYITRMYIKIQRYNEGKTKYINKQKTQLHTI